MCVSIIDGGEISEEMLQTARGIFQPRGIIERRLESSPIKPLSSGISMCLGSIDVVFDRPLSRCHESTTQQQLGTVVRWLVGSTLVVPTSGKQEKREKVSKRGKRRDKMR